MRRLKITLLMLFIFVTLSLVALASEVNKRRRSFFDSPFFQDESLESAILQFENRLSEFSGFSQSMFKTQWQQDEKGRTFLIQPSDKNQKLDIKIENGMIHIKSAQESQTQNSRSQAVSTQMMSIPEDCDANAAEISQLTDGVKIFFPYFKEGKAKKTSTPERLPLPAPNEAIDI